MIKNKIYNYAKAREKGMSFFDFLRMFIEKVDVSLKAEDVVIPLDIPKKIKEAIKNKLKIAIIGDYDVDGVTSSAILYKTITSLGGDVTVILPDRYDDGYGLSENLIKKASEINAKVLITVDNGINAIDAVTKAENLGMEVLITDHHIPNDNQWKVKTAFNPHCVENSLKTKEVCGAYVALLIALKLNPEIYITKLAELKELAAIGTIADRMPVIKENQTLIFEVLQDWKKGIVRNKGLRTLITALNKFGIKETDEDNVGFYLAPCLNASGRLAKADLALNLLLSDSSRELCKYSQELVSLNARRQELTNKATVLVNTQIDEESKVQVINIPKDFPANPREIEGIIGLVAQKCVDISGCPSLVFFGNKFSSRSTPDVNLHKLLSSVKGEISSLSFGGHKQACGGKIDFTKDCHSFKRSLNKFFDSCTFETELKYIRIPEDMDFEELHQATKDIRPCGELPQFIIDNVSVSSPAEKFGEKHTKFKIILAGKQIEVMKFNEQIKVPPVIKRLVFKTNDFMNNVSLIAEAIA